MTPSMLDGDGASLSQGERQLQISPGPPYPKPYPVLDEATGSVDTRTEKYIEQGMDRLMRQDHIRHCYRLSTVRNSDPIIVLEHGEIAAGHP